MSGKILVLFAHPAIHRSRANAALLDKISALPGLTVHDLYAAYPDLVIDVEREQGLLSSHDAVVIQHPLYWYSAPAIVKEWLDVVLEHGFAYGQAGLALSGKPWMHVVTAGGRVEAYRETGRNRFSIDEFFRPFEATAHLCHARWIEPFVLFGSHLATPSQIAAEGDRLVARLQVLGENLGADRAPAAIGGEG